MPRPVIYLIYNLLLPVFLVAGLPGYLVKGARRGGLARNFGQRLGLFAPATRDRLRARAPLWLHAVSVGEVFVALKILRALRDQAPDRPLVLSTTTSTGFRVAEEASLDGVTVIHNPVDLPLVARGVLDRIAPAALILVESEIWPNLVALARHRKIPVALVNARLSPRSEQRYRRFRPVIRPVFSQLDRMLVPFPADVSRWSALGIPADRISVSGSVKFDEASAPEAGDRAAPLRDWLERTGCRDFSRILLAASTHDGEEILAARVWHQLLPRFPGLVLVIVPRHAERGPGIAETLRDEEFTPVLRSRSHAATGTTDPDAGTVWLADTTGELRSWYELAAVVIVGKSFTAKGGQNPVEPILAGKPVVVGPHMGNFREVVQDLREADGIRQIDRPEELGEAVGTLLENPASGEALAQRGATALAKHDGAAARTASSILGLIGEENGTIDESPAGQRTPRTAD